MAEITEVVLKAQLGDGPVQEVGRQDVYPEDLEGMTTEEFLQNRAADWAYHAAHSDCLKTWAELPEVTE